MPQASPSPRSGYAKSRETRARILTAALADASDFGFHKTSVARVAARAGVAVGNLNYHFGSRSGLMRELMGWLAADLMDRLHAVDTEDGADFFERQCAGLRMYLAYSRENPGYVRLADEIKLHEPEIYRASIEAWVKIMAERIRAGIAEGSVRPMDELEIAAQAHFVLGARHFVEHMIESPHGPDDEAVLDAYLALIRDGLGRRKRTR
jgi:AcrR family transcriptional regulator